jgi:hypothetical protein
MQKSARYGLPRASQALSGAAEPPTIFGPAVAAREAAYRFWPQPACGKRGHPEGDRRSRWRFPAPNARLGATAAKRPYLAYPKNDG